MSKTAEFAAVTLSFRSVCVLYASDTRVNLSSISNLNSHVSFFLVFHPHKLIMRGGYFIVPLTFCFRVALAPFTNQTLAEMSAELKPLSYHDLMMIINSLVFDVKIIK